MSSFPTSSTNIESQSAPSTAYPPAATGRLDRSALPNLSVERPRRTSSFSQSRYHINSQTSSPFPNIQPSVSLYPAESIVTPGYLYEDPSSNEPQGEPKGRVGYSPLAAPIANPYSSSTVHSLARGSFTHHEDHGKDEDDEFVSAASEDDENIENQGAATSVAQQRAERRKMKRFRQTRFLMSEFARQAHPDAAQRERLSREIPGLSSRQVQVWFQNRRAKLKRLTTDDQERMLKSRALPAGFNTTQALHSPYDGYLNSTETSANPSLYTSLNRGSEKMPIVTEGSLGQVSQDDGMISPVSMASSFGEYHTTPNSVSTTENLSPNSPASERSYVFSTPTTQGASPRNLNPFARSSSFSSTYTPYFQNTRGPLQERVGRSRTGSLASPLRTELSQETEIVGYSIPELGHETLPASAAEPSLYGLMPNDAKAAQQSIGDYSAQSESSVPAYTNQSPDDHDWYIRQDTGTMRSPSTSSNVLMPTNQSGFEQQLRPQYGSLAGLPQPYQVGPLQPSVRGAPLAPSLEFDLLQRGLSYQPSESSELYLGGFGGVVQYHHHHAMPFEPSKAHVTQAEASPLGFLPPHPASNQDGAEDINRDDLTPKPERVHEEIQGPRPPSSTGGFLQ
ncbi:MAG: hypothetical protein Q9167_000627 [Letrouitia subvulpina]